MPEPPDELEPRIRELTVAGDYDGAATLFIEKDGGDILKFLAGRLGNPSDAAEVFSIFAEAFWRGFPGFQWRSSLRTWAYTLARNAAYGFLHDPQRKRLQLTTIASHKSRFARAVTQLGAATETYLRSEVKRQVRDLYKKLSYDDQCLLYLRIDQQMSWQEIATVISGQGEQMEEAENKRWANRLRQRFHVVKQRLKELAEEEGLIG